MTDAALVLYNNRPVYVN